jgi:hypothetical protein
VSEAILKHSRMPRRYSRRTLKKREEQALAGMGNLDGVEPKAMLARYCAGARVADLAKEYAVAPITIYQFFLRNVHDDWQAAQKARALANKEGGEDAIDDAADPLEVAKAREKLRAGQWDLERVDRKNYGRDEQNININVFDLGDRLRRAKERTTQVIEHSVSAPLSVKVARGHEEEAETQLIEDAGLAGIESGIEAETHVQAQQSGDKA